ncbi:MAG: glycosyltransferase family 2 protein [Anaerolineaceae bacterium]|nr:glycosyltransferase family 2 protein [Anaerolineaceae bacterium]
MTALLTVFIPAYNEGENLERCIVSLELVLEKTGTSFEILIVDDASCDRTGDIAERFVHQDQRVRVLHHPKNLGIGGSFCTAVKHAYGDWLILIPADLAMNPDDLPIYLAAASQADVVVGLRSNRDDYSFFRKLVSWINIHLIQLLFGMRERQFQFISMYRLAVLRAIKIEYWHSAFFLAEVLIKAKALGYRLVEVEIRYLPRRLGRATGVHGAAIFNTMRDMFHFWLRWNLL